MTNTQVLTQVLNDHNDKMFTRFKGYTESTIDGRSMSKSDHYQSVMLRLLETVDTMPSMNYAEMLTVVRGRLFFKIKDIYSATKVIKSNVNVEVIEDEKSSVIDVYLIQLISELNGEDKDIVEAYILRGTNRGAAEELGMTKSKYNNKLLKIVAMMKLKVKSQK